MSGSPLPLIPVIVGPTASGKSDLGINLALELEGEIINLDSVQVYRGIYVATSKVPLAERKGVPHHLIDIVEPVHNFTAGDYSTLAYQTIGEIEARGKRPILAGGTGFYLRAMVRPLFTSPRTDPDLRERLIRIREKHGPIFLHRMLKRLDPATAEVLKPGDWSRTMRAIEVRLQTGRRLSEVQVESESPPEPASRLRVICLNPNRDLLYARINERAVRMFESGLVEEVQSLIDSGVPPNAKAFQAHGYRRVVEYLQGLRSREDALNQMKLDTRHYAKRQLSWWRAWDSVYWINRFGDQPEALVEGLSHLAS